MGGPGRLALLLALMAAPAAALVTPVQEEPVASPTVQPMIEAELEAGSDERIAERIAGIYSEIPHFADVSVSVSEGVVTLGGEVADADGKARAEAIAARVSGVVTVENAIDRDVSVGQGLSGLGSVSGRVDQLWRIAPLLGAALLVALAIGALGYALASVSALWKRVAPNYFMAELIASAIRFVFVMGGIVVALDMVGASALLGAVLGGAGVVGIALGFAMRDTIENYVASLMLSLRQPFRPNDWVVIDQHEGRVIRLTSRATILMTLDGNHLRIPNSMVFKAVILNYTRNPQRRFDFVLGIDAADDPTAARHLAVEVLRGLDFVLDDPEPQGRVEEVGDSNIVIRFLGWIDQRETDWYKARSRAIPAVKQALEAAGFAIPEPIYRLRFDSPPPLGERAEPESSASQHSVRAPATEAEETDTAPETSVTEMVEQERAVVQDDKDLLDPRRPVE